jgi:hypothetical protein
MTVAFVLGKKAETFGSLGPDFTYISSKLKSPFLVVRPASNRNYGEAIPISFTHEGTDTWRSTVSVLVSLWVVGVRRTHHEAAWRAWQGSGDQSVDRSYHISHTICSYLLAWTNYCRYAVPRTNWIRSFEG